MNRPPLRNEYAWSVSRDNAFLECPRQYFYRYYGHWGGWEMDADSRTREIYMLKQLKSRPLWIGEVVHDCIKRSLQNLKRGIRVLPVEKILAITRDRMRSDFRSSRAGKYRGTLRGTLGLFEHEYDVPVSDQQWREAAEQVDTCLRNFYASDVYGALASTAPDDFLEVEEMSRIPIDGTDVIIRLDCAVRESQRIVVWDWKSGRRESENSPLQMACYAFYASQRYKIPVRHVATRRFELFTNRIHDPSLSEGAVDDLLGYIRGSIQDMQSLLDDPERNVASEARFSQAPKRERCHRCNFLRVCQPALPE